MDNYESLLQFLYQIPTPTARVNSAGTIDMLNPAMTSMLLVLQDGGSFKESIYETLDSYTEQSKEKLKVETIGDERVLSITLPAGFHLKQIRVTCRKIADDEFMIVINDTSSDYTLESLKNNVDRMFKHDLRNQINTINVYSALIGQTCTDEQRADLDVIKNSAQSLNTMLNNSLDYFRMETGSYTLNKAPFDIVASAEHIARGVQEKFGQNRGLSVVTTSEKIVIEADKPHVETVLSNLIKNAFEAAPESSDVTIRLAAEDMLKIAVHNRGTIPAENQKRFFSLYNSSDKAGSNGLGVYTAALITTTHGGSISFSSTEHDGTEIVVLLPLK